MANTTDDLGSSSSIAGYLAIGKLHFSYLFSLDPKLDNIDFKDGCTFYALIFSNDTVWHNHFELLPHSTISISCNGSTIYMTDWFRLTIYIWQWV